MKMSQILVCSGIETMMHGVAYFKFAGKNCTAVYSDRTEETAEIPEALRLSMRGYYAYQNENGPACDAPNTFALVSAIQDHRPSVIA